jgi:hypothetical protein
MPMRREVRGERGFRERPGKIFCSEFIQTLSKTSFARHDISFL